MLQPNPLAIETTSRASFQLQLFICLFPPPPPPQSVFYFFIFLAFLFACFIVFCLSQASKPPMSSG